MKPLYLKFRLLILFSLCISGFGFQQQTDFKHVWPERYSASYGFTLMADHNGVIIVASVDTTSNTYKLGVRPGMELLGWNTLPLKRKLDEMKVRKYKNYFPGLSDEKIKLILICRGSRGETAEAFFMTATGNNRGIKLTATN